MPVLSKFLNKFNLKDLTDNQSKELFSDVLIILSSFIQMKRYIDGIYIQDFVLALRELSDNF